MINSCKIVLANTVDNFNDSIGEQLLGIETPYFKTFFPENYEPGTFTLYERKNSPSFLSDYEQNYSIWLRRVVTKELTALAQAGALHYPLSDELVEAVYRQISDILDFKLQNGKRISELIYNQEYCDIIHRIILWLLTGQPNKEVNLFKELNAIGLEVAKAILSNNTDLDLQTLMKWSIASGAIGIDMKGEDAAASPLTSCGIELGKKYRTILDKVDFVNGRLNEISKRGFEINFWAEFEREIVNSKEPYTLAWFPDDYIETIFDLKFIERLLTENNSVRLYLVPRNGRYVNDASYTDVLDLLNDPLFSILKKYVDNNRLIICKEGPAASCINGKKISKEVAEIICKSNGVLLKGARTYEMMQGLKKTAYFAFIVIREFSEVVTGLDARTLPLVLIRQSAGDQSFQGFRNRAFNKCAFSDGRIINVSSKTALNFDKEKHPEFY